MKKERIEEIRNLLNEACQDPLAESHCVLSDHHLSMISELLIWIYRLEKSIKKIETEVRVATEETASGYVVAGNEVAVKRIKQILDELK